MRYAYYPGCSLETSAKEFDMSIREVFKVLGIELVELDDWCCCGSTPGHMTSELLSVSLPLRNLELAANLGLDVVAPCASCFSRLKMAVYNVENNKELRNKVEKVIGTDDLHPVKVRHPLDVLVEELGIKKIGEFVVRRLEGLKVASYYGCLLVRPPEIMQFDEPEDPVSMDRLVKVLGADPVRWEYKTECCGAILALSNPDIEMRLTSEILKRAKEAEADLILVACPLCHSNLEMLQVSRGTNIPILYFSQLLGIGLGIRAKSLGLNRNMVSPFETLSTFIGKEEVTECLG